jgi:hypothetical protein
MSRRKYETDRTSDLLTAEKRGEMRGEMRSDKKWESVVAEKDDQLAEQAVLLADKDVLLAKQAAEIAELRAKSSDGK